MNSVEMIWWLRFVQKRRGFFIVGKEGLITPQELLALRVADCSFNPQFVGYMKGDTGLSLYVEAPYYNEDMLHAVAGSS